MFGALKEIQPDKCCLRRPKTGDSDSGCLVGGGPARNASRGVGSLLRSTCRASAVHSASVAARCFTGFPSADEPHLYLKQTIWPTSSQSRGPPSDAEVIGGSAYDLDALGVDAADV